MRTENPELGEFFNLAELGRSSASPLHLPFVDSEKNRAEL
jgi:hypothetical protein